MVENSGYAFMLLHVKFKPIRLVGVLPHAILKIGGVPVFDHR
jgi:hypothetical protein